MKSVCALLLGIAFLAGTANAEKCHDDYNRYELKVPLNKDVVVTTAYDSGPVTLAYARRLLAPVSPAPLDGPHFVGYEADDTPNLAGPTNVLVDTDLADFVVSETKGLMWVEVPAVKDAVPPLVIPAPPGDQPAYACYRVKIAGPNMLKATQHTIDQFSDQFGGQLLTILQPESLCVPATLDGSMPPAGSARACFTVKASKPVVDPPTVALSTVFQGFLFDLEPVDEYCIQATVSPAP